MCQNSFRSNSMQFRESLKPNEAWDAFSIVPPSDDSQIRDAWVSFFHKVIEQYFSSDYFKLC